VNAMKVFAYGVNRCLTYASFYNIAPDCIENERVKRIFSQ